MKRLCSKCGFERIYVNPEGICTACMNIIISLRKQKEQVEEIEKRQENERKEKLRLSSIGLRTEEEVFQDILTCTDEEREKELWNERRKIKALKNNL